MNHQPEPTARDNLFNRLVIDAGLSPRWANRQIDLFEVELHQRHPSPARAAAFDEAADELTTFNDAFDPNCHCGDCESCISRRNADVLRGMANEVRDKLRWLANEPSSDTAPAVSAGVSPAPDQTEVDRLHAEILTGRAEIAELRDLLGKENQRANAAIAREETAEQAALEAGQERDRLLATDQTAPCRTTQHCAHHGWCHRCAPDFAAVMGLVNVAIQRTEPDESRWGPLYEAVGKALRDAPAAVLPASVDRADVLREAADIADRTARDCAPSTAAIVAGIAARLRLMALGMLRPVATETPNTTETDGEAQGAVRCTASVLRKPHGPHGWEPQPGMTPVRCPGFCNCDHPAEEHSVYGCVDGCACEYLPPTGAPAGGAPQPKEA